MVSDNFIGDSPDVYPFDEISFAEFGFEKFSGSS